MRSRPPLGQAVLVAMIAALTSWTALTGWRGFVVDSGSYLAPLLLIALAVGLVGAALRWIGSPAVVTVGAQVLVAVAATSAELGGSPVPAGAAAERIAAGVRDAVATAQSYAAPIGPEVPPVTPLLLIGGVVFVLLVDLIACTLRRVPIAGLALLAIYSVPAGVVQAGPGWMAFLGAAAGFLALLHLDTREHLLRWGRPLGPRESSPWADNNPLSDAFRVGAGRIGVSATALALLLSPLVPVLDIDLLGFGPGDGDDEIEIEKPIADMRRDLERGVDVPLVRITTRHPDPGYLRVAVLNRFTGVEWTSGNRVVSGAADGELPQPVGLSPSVPRTTYDYEVEVTDDLRSTWLPTQFPASSVVAEGDWQYDPATLDFVADGDTTTAGLSYEMTGIEPDFGTSGAFFQDSVPSAVDEEALTLPGGIPSEVRSWAFRITAGATTDYERARLLQQWFRDDDRFRYSLERAPDGTGGETLEAFLSEEGRVGYCEQFASAMAVLARIVDIPARVAVGFLQPKSLGGGEWEYSTRDLHAWPELYFEGAGWVRFEPTPGRPATTAPDYSRVPVDNRALPTDNRGTEPLETTPSTENPRAEQRDAAAEERAERERREGADSGFGWGRVLLWAGVTLLVLALLVAVALSPRALRSAQRRRRLGGGPDELWQELRATAVDLELPWPDGRSPRQVGTALADHLGDPAAAEERERPRTGPGVHPVATAALEDLVGAVERRRYARPGAPAPDGLAEATATCVASLRAGAPRRARVRATWLPRSVWRRPPPAAVTLDERELVGR